MKKNYLSKVAMSRDQKAHRKFKCKAVVWIVYKRSATQPIVTCRAVINDISQGGATVSITGDEIPDHFYIVIGNNEHAIGCSVVGRARNFLTVYFIMEQPQRLIEAFAMLSVPMAPLFSLRGLMRNAIIQEKAFVSNGSSK